eukprot:gene33659-40721_t
MSSFPATATPSQVGSPECPYKLVIIGGGPAGCSIVVRAIRIGYLKELCGMSGSIMGGVCLVERGGLDRLGGGRLQDYVINSNTHVDKFVLNVTQDKQDNLPPESVKNSVLDGLDRTEKARELLNRGSKVGPLSSVGGFLRDVGKATLDALNAFPESSRCCLNTTVESLQLVSRGPKELDNASNSQVYNGVLWKITLAPTPTSPASSPLPTQDIYASHVVLCTGGKQEALKLPPQLASKVMLSDVACTSEGVQELKKRIRKQIKANPSSGVRVAIVGGSHSAFSAAWVCMHKVDEAQDAVPTAVPSITFPSSSICILHRSPICVYYATRHDAEKEGYLGGGMGGEVNKITGEVNPWGGIRGDAKELWQHIRAGKESRVRLLQIRSGIGVFGGAGAGGSGGEGTSGAAGVRQSIVEKILGEAAVVVMACGYATHLPPILDEQGNPLEVVYDGLQVKVDDHTRMLTPSLTLPPPSPTRHAQAHTSAYPPSHSSAHPPHGLPIPQLYGVGLGFGLSPSEGGVGSTGGVRADGVAVYLKRGATLVLAEVLGIGVYGGGGVSSWEERAKILRKKKWGANSSSANNSSSNTVEGKGSDDSESDEPPSLPPRLTIPLSPAARKTTSSNAGASGGVCTPQRVKLGAGVERQSFSGVPSPPAHAVLSSSLPSPNQTTVALRNQRPQSTGRSLRGSRAEGVGIDG